MTRWTRLATLGLPLLLSGCVQYYDIAASLEGGKIVFAPSNWGAWRDPGCILTVAVGPVTSQSDSMGLGVDGVTGQPQAVWDVGGDTQAFPSDAALDVPAPTPRVPRGADEMGPGERAQSCTTFYPLTYGQAIDGEGAGAAKPLAPGQVYAIHIVTDGPDFGSGLFRLDGKGGVENLESSDLPRGEP